MLTPAKLRIFGFRGFRDVAEFQFDAPWTLLFGENGSCKSSTLNAIEWALYGDECVGKQTGIRERLGWIIPNRHAAAPNVGVELTLNAPHGIHVLRRRLRHVGRKSTLQAELELTLPDGRTLTADEAEERLVQLRKSSFRDFATTVYQHQESIRNLLTQEPRDRHDAIDRLLGLSSQRNLLGALDAARLGSRQKEIALRFSELEEQLKTALTSRSNDLAELQHEAHQAGIARDRLTAAAAVQEAHKVAESLQAFGKATGLAMPQLPAPSEWAAILEFDKAARAIIAQLRGRVPGIEDQERLLQRQRALLGVHAAMNDIRRRSTEVDEEAAQLEKEHGSAKAVETKIACASQAIEVEQERLRQTSGHAAVVNEAIKFLEGAIGPEPPCPVCGSEVRGLRGQLQQLWSEKLQTMAQQITSRIGALHAERNALQAIAGRHARLVHTGGALQEAATALRGQVAGVLQRALTAKDDALVLVATELRAAEDQLQQLAQAIHERQQQLDAIEQQLAGVRLIRNYLHQESKKQGLAKIRSSPAFRTLELQRDRVAQLVDDVEAVKNALAVASREEAEAKLASAEQAIDTYFRQLSRHAAVKRLKLAVSADKRTHRNAYDVTDQDGNDLAPILSQGDLNALALAIFLGLATAAADSVFGCVLLDDPSQSLSSEHKKALALLLGEVARHKKLIVATMDAEFHQYLMASANEKREYRFASWTPERGPSIAPGGSKERATATRPAQGTNERRRRH
jgi:exonuclease SbcC